MLSLADLHLREHLQVHPAVFDRYLAELSVKLPQRMATLGFLRVVNLCRLYPVEDVAVAVEQAMASAGLGMETVLDFLRSNDVFDEIASIAPMSSAPPCPSVQERDLARYGLLLGR